uniref:Uncharacterized protein n=1 Tax=Aegilops tauschii TaxID=37682 RepID=N1QZF3_AEGTA
MGDQASLLPDLALEAIFVRLPPRDFHRCRCLSRAWAAKLSSDDLIDLHLRVRRKIRLDYDDIMQSLLLKCSIDHRRRARNHISEEIGSGDLTEEEPSGEDNDDGHVNDDGGKEESSVDDDEDGDEGEEEDWREEYRTRGYVEVDEDYYIRRAELHALAKDEWAEAMKDVSGMTVTDSNDPNSFGAKLLKACAVPYGALPPRIREPFLEGDPALDSSENQDETEGHNNIRRIRGREKTEEEVDQEIIAFLRRLRDMDPQPTFLREFDTYRWPPVFDQGQEEMAAFVEEVGQEGDSYYSEYHSDDGEFEEDSDTDNSEIQV